MGAVETQQITRNVNKLSKTGQLQVLLTESPELLVLLEEFNSKLEELKDKVEPVFPIISKVNTRTEIYLKCIGVPYACATIEPAWSPCAR